MRSWIVRCVGLGAAAVCLAAPAAAGAAPSTLIILRHGEKANAYALSAVGQLRAQALAAQWLGKGAAPSIFAGLPSPKPAAILSTTLHTIELAAPSADTWGQPLISYTAVPAPKAAFTKTLNGLTQRAAHDVLTDPRWTGRTVVVCWEHDHIAKSSLEKQFPGQKVTWRQLLGLQKLKVPKTWPGSTYDYFWVIGMDPKTGKAKSFRLVRQTFTGAYASVPQNAWGKPE